MGHLSRLCARAPQPADSAQLSSSHLNSSQLELKSSEPAAWALAGAEWWVVARSDAAPRVAVGKPATKPDCLVTISDAHLVALAAGKLNGSALPEHAKSPPRAPRREPSARQQPAAGGQPWGDAPGEPTRQQPPW